MFTPFLDAPLVIQVHIVSALIVALFMPFQFWVFRKGSTPHRITGYVWLAAIAILALSSFGITSRFLLSFGGFSIIHLLSALTLVTIVGIVRSARRGAVQEHRALVISLSISFWIAGAFTLLPSRIMGRIVSGFFS